MVTKKKGTGEKETKRGKVTVGKLKLNKETVMDLSAGEQKRIKGGVARETDKSCICASDLVCTIGCPTWICAKGA